MTLADQATITGHHGQVTSGKPERPKRRAFTAAYKARIVAAYDELPEGLATVIASGEAQELLQDLWASAGSTEETYRGREIAAKLQAAHSPAARRQKPPAPEENSQSKPPR